MGTAVAPGRSPTEVTCGVAGTAGYSEHLDYTIHSFVIKCILTLLLFYSLADAPAIYYAVVSGTADVGCGRHVLKYLDEH